MASTLAHLIAYGSFLMAASASAMEIVATVTPANAQACVWDAKRQEERRCTRVDGGRFAATIEDAALATTFVEISAPSHFAVVLPLRDIAGREVRLDPHPLLHWSGWNRDADTTVEWLSAASGAEWRKLGAIRAGEERELPDETRAVRFSSPKASPRTYFFAAPRASLRTPRNEPLRDGGEIALCIAKANITVRVRAASGRIFEEETPAHGCLSFSGLEPDVYDVVSPNEAFEPLRARVDAGRSVWLGMLQWRPPAIVRVRVDDADNSRRYSVSVAPSFVAAGERPSPPKTVAGGTEAEWEVRAGNYDVKAHPEAFPGVEFAASATVESGAETTITLRPSYITVVGRATTRGASTPNVELEFLSADNNRIRVTTRAKTGSDGRYEVVLPTPGRWRVVAATPGQRTWKPYEIVHDVPLAERYEWDVELPGGELKGRVVDEANGDPIADLPIEIHWQIEKEPPGFVTITTDTNGRFRAGALPDTTVTVRGSDAMARILGYVPATAHTIDITDNAAEIVIRLRRSRSIVRISVVDGAGNPVRTAQLFHATADPATPLLARADGNGNIDVPDDAPLPLVAYIVATGHPWQRIVINQPREEPLRVTLGPAPAPTQVALTGATGEVQNARWGLIDADGLQVPLFFHLIGQNVLPVLRGSVATIPAPGSGAYRLWVHRGGIVRVVGTIMLPSSTIVVLNLE